MMPPMGAAESDTYRCLDGEHRQRIKVQRSEFIGISLGIRSEDEFAEHRSRLEKEFHDATHHCWAFRLRDAGGVLARCADAGEPAGTAGRPILNVLEGESLVDSGVVVVRYYGGVKLGTGGLARAYRDAAKAALAEAPAVEKILYRRVRVVVPFESLNVLYRMISPPDIILAGEQYGERNLFDLDVRLSLFERVRTELREKRLETTEPGSGE